MKLKSDIVPMYVHVNLLEVNVILPEMIGTITTYKL